MFVRFYQSRGTVIAAKIASAEAKPTVARFSRRDLNKGDRVFAHLVRGLAIALAVTLGLIVFFLAEGSMPIWKKFGLGFVVSSTWDPVMEVFGALPTIYGTIVSSLLALFIASPLSVGAALMLNEIAPGKISSVIGFCIEMLAAIPSVVYGLWGIFVLAPWLRESVEPFLSEHLGFIPLFDGPPYGVGMLAGGIVLAIMIAPTITAITREVFKAIPGPQREGAIALGATKWEVIKLSVLRSSYGGIFGAMTLGLGRALGETMAVTMLIGNRPDISISLFEPAQTMASIIANEYAEASSDVHLAALTGIGLVLFIVTLLINGVARMIVMRTQKKWS